MDKAKKVLAGLSGNIKGGDGPGTLSYVEFLDRVSGSPGTCLRNVFQVFHDMVKSFVGEGLNEYPEDPESVGFDYFDTTRLFVEKTDHPFFADRLFANRFINRVEALRSGAQQNKIYIFDGPPGCGKSTFLNNLLKKFEEYANDEEGTRYEVVWRLERSLMGGFNIQEADRFLEALTGLIRKAGSGKFVFDQHQLESPEDGSEGRCSAGFMKEHDSVLEVPCPSHDHPILMIPQELRAEIIDELIDDFELKWNLRTEKEYEWIWRERPCTICEALFQALLEKTGDPLSVYGMIFARPYHFNRRLGEGVSVFNPGDRPAPRNSLTNPMIQNRLDMVFRDSAKVQYLCSRYAKTNNGVYALMDIKSHNKDRLIELHNIISEGVHKVEDIEENVNSLFVAVMNPEDKVNIEPFQSFSDRIEYISIPYVLDLRTEVEIYRSIFGRHIDESFLPRVLHNFARAIISTRLEEKSEALSDWIGDPFKYHLYCDEKLHLLKMDLYTGYIPPWLSEEDRKAFTAKKRRRMLAEADQDGKKGFSGRDSIKIFNEFYSTYAKDDGLINMSMLQQFFTKARKDLARAIPEGFLSSMLRMYNYLILQEVKESLYYYNENRIVRDIKNYLFALNFEIGSTEICTFTGERLEITEEFLESIETRLLGKGLDPAKRSAFRLETQKEYTSRTLTQEMLLEDQDLAETRLFKDLREKYIHSLKQKVLDPFLENENFRRAITDFGTEAFKTYDKRIKSDVAFLLDNLQSKFKYTALGAREVCIYVIDNNLARAF